MFGAIAKSLFGSSNDRYVKSLNPLIARIAGFEAQLQALDDAELAASGWRAGKRSTRCCLRRSRRCARRRGACWACGISTCR